MRMPKTPWPSMNCLVLLLVLSLLYGCGAVSKGTSPSNQRSTKSSTQPSSVVVTPATGQTRAGDTQQFSATVSGLPVGNSGGANPGVTWSVNSVPGGNATVGTIDAKGLYTAPATLPNQNRVRVTATSIAEPLLSAMALVTLDNPIPMVTTISPTTVLVGSFTLIINGGRFAKGARVFFGNTALPTTYVSATQLTAMGTAIQQQVGAVPVTVQNPDPGSTMSAGVNVQVDSNQIGDFGTPIPSTLFGNYSELTNWPQVPTGTFAGSLVQWVYLEQTKEVYKWTTLDKYVSLANSHGADFIWNYSDAPPWAVGGGTDCRQESNWSLPQCTCRVASDGVSTACDGGVTDLQSLHDFMVELVSRYNGKSGHGRIAAYNLANEPEYYGATVEQVAAQVNTMHDAIRATDPTAKVVGIALDVPNTYFAPSQYMDKFWAAGGTKDFDAVSIHGYPHHPPLDNSPETIIGYVATVQDCFTRNNIPSTMPIWDTESSYGDPTYRITEPDAQTGWLARSYLEHWSSGISRYYWYGYDDISYGTLWTPTAGLNATGIAYQQVYNWMAGATMSGPCAMAPDSTWTCHFTRPGGYEAQAVWNGLAPTTYLVPIQYTQFRDLTGAKVAIPTSGVVTIGSKPILLEAF